MEKDAINFLITTVTHNYPNFVSKILVYKMPWVIASMWKLVRSMLPQRTVEMIKFVNSDTIKEFVALGQLVAPCDEITKSHA